MSEWKEYRQGQISDSQCRLLDQLGRQARALRDEAEAAGIDVDGLKWNRAYDGDSLIEWLGGKKASRTVGLASKVIDAAREKLAKREDEIALHRASASSGGRDDAALLARVLDILSRSGTEDQDSLRSWLMRTHPAGKS